MRQWLSAVVLVGSLGLAGCGVPSTGAGGPEEDADGTGGAEDMGSAPLAPDTAPFFPPAPELPIDRAPLPPDMAPDAPAVMMMPPDAAVPDAPGGKGNGAACVAGGDCTSGFCADGVCCMTACTDTCSSCYLTGTIGTCAPRPAGMDPDNECAAEPATSCGLDGMCDGKGACRKHATGTECLPGSCAGSTESAARTCDGMGTCRPAATKMCDPFVCDGNACATACTGDTQCKAPSFCDRLANRCVGQKAAGSTCTAASECATGNCADGVCCMTDCKDICKACNVTGSLGMCVVVPDGQDPRSVCMPEAPATCGLDGQCDGKGACRKHPVGTVCVAPSCAVATFTSARTCDGLGMCRPATTMSCGAFQCMGAACGAGCTVDGECATGLYCQAGACVTKKATAASCTRAGECSTGNCVDGFCCDNACTAGCRACNIAGLVGTCSPVPGGLDPHNACAATVSTTCGLDGECDGLGACRFFGIGTPCGTGASCQNGTASTQLACDGGGMCRPSMGTSCSPYLCANATTCATACTVDTDCAAGYYCEGVTCVAKKILGQVCGRAAMCTLGNCIDTVCCDTTCTGACRACNVAGLLGTCSNVVTGQDPDNDCAPEAASTCGRDGMCNGAGACRLHPMGTVCVAGTCTAGVENAQTCNGTGTCGAAAMTTCAPYLCGATSCARPCSGASNCVVDYWCSGAGVCTDLLAGLVGRWKFDEGTGTTAADSSASANTGTLTGGPTWAGSGFTPVPKFANPNSLTFDGVDDYVATANDLNAVLGGTASLSVWVKTTQTATGSTWQLPGITGVESAGNGNDIFWGSIDSTGSLLLQAGDGANVSSGVINNNAWHHVVMTRNATTGALEIWVDGVSRATATGEAGMKTTPFSGIGRVLNSPAPYFSGQLDDVRIYNRVLAAGEVAALYAGQ